MVVHIFSMEKQPALRAVCFSIRFQYFINFIIHGSRITLSTDFKTVAPECVRDSVIAQKTNFPGGSRRKSRKNIGGQKTKKRKGGRRHRKSQRRSRR